MRLVAVQCAPGDDRDANIAQIDGLLNQAGPGPALVCLPEMWTCLGGDRARKLSQSETLPRPGSSDEAGPAWRFLSAAARRLGITLHGGSIGEREGDTLFNTSLVFGPDGRELARYRKIHLFDAVTPQGRGYRESSLFGAGAEVVTCPIGLPGGQATLGQVTLGLSVCYDVRFPELFTALRRQGAGIIAVPSAFTMETGRDHWEVLLRARAIETQCWLVAPATTGTHHDAAGRPRQTFGHSLICDPWGEVRARLEDGPGVASAEFDQAMLDRVRTSMPVLAHRRLA